MQLNINCEIEQGEFIGLYGPSGAGKTSVLRMLGGFMRPDNGFIKVNDELWYTHEKNTNVAPGQRKIGFVFQDYALFPNMNVKENITFALAKGESKKIVDELLELTGLTMLAIRKIQTLSGGQQQRVALARAIAKKPALLLLDEPLSAIDNAMRKQLQETLWQVHKQYHLTTILVSHDEHEIIRLADKIIHLNNGTIQEFTTPSVFFFNESHHLSGLSGNVLSVEKNEAGNSVFVLIHNRILKIIKKEYDADNLRKGDKVQIMYKDSVPVIHKL